MFQINLRLNDIYFQNAIHRAYYFEITSDYYVIPFPTWMEHCFFDYD